MRETTVVLGIDDPGLQEEVLHFLERLPGARVVGAAERADELATMVRDRRPLAVVGQPDLLLALQETTALAVAPRETSRALRDALRAGARGFFVWPEERDALAGAIRGMRPVARSDGDDPGLVVGVLGARGGAGATFLATNLAAAFARLGAETVLTDLDLLFGDVAPALGKPPGEQLSSVADLRPVSRELAAEHLDPVLHVHEEGFRVLFAPPKVTAEASVHPEMLASAVRVLRDRFEATILHLPRSLDDSVRTAIELADEVLLVVTLDVLALRAAKRMVDHLRSVGLGAPLRLVVNRAGRGEVVPRDAAEVLDLPIAAVIPSDRAVQRAQNRGELVVGRRGQASRRTSRLAGQLLEQRRAA